MRYVTSLSLALMLIVSTWAAGSTLESGTVATTLVPRTIEYNVLLPDGYSADGDRYPLILALAGGPGDSSLLKQYQKSFDRLWQTDELPKLVVVMPSVRPFSSYTDFRDGSEKWESAVLGPFLEHVRVRYHVTSDHRKTVLIGHSMGGHGGLQMAMRHPEKLGAVVAAAPGIPPAIKWEEVELRNRSFLSEGHWKVLYGDPIDPDYWEQCNPASIVTSVYGDSPTFVQGIRALRKLYVMDVSSEIHVWLQSPKRLRSGKPETRPISVAEALSQLPEKAWKRMTVAEGSQGPRVYEYAELLVWFSEEGLPTPTFERLLFRRSLGQKAEIKYQRSNAPLQIKLPQLAQVGGQRWTIEQDFQAGKGECGLDEYETRGWTGWHHHTALSMLALFFLTLQRRRMEKKRKTNDRARSACLVAAFA